MSYDLHMFRPQPGVDPQVTAEATFEGDAETLDPGETVPEKEERKKKLAEALMRADPSLQPFRFDYAQVAKLRGVSETEARRQFRHIELNGPEDGNGIQLTLFDDTASLAIPYWHSGAQAESVWNEVWICLATLEAVAGFSVYDPQLGKVLDRRSARGSVMTKYQEGVQFTESLGTDGKGGRKPWWKFW